MNETLKGLLYEMGLPWDSSEEAAQAFYDALTDDLKNELKAKLDAAAAAATAEAAQVNATASAAATTTTAASAKNDASKVTALAAATRINAKNPGRTKAITDDGDQVLLTEGKRVTQINQLATTLGIDGDEGGKRVAQLAIAHGDTVVDAKKRFLKHLTDTATPFKEVRVGEDKKLAMLAAAIPDAVSMKFGCTKFYESDHLGRVKRDEAGKAVSRAVHAEAARFSSLRFSEIVRHVLVSLGAPAEEMSMLGPSRLVELASPRNLRRAYPQVAQLAQSTSDFDNILLDAQNKTMRMAYVEAARTWNVWAKRGTAPDFKNINRLQISEVPNLTARNEGHGIDYVTLSDSKEVYALAEYTAGVRLTRRVLINDELGVFGSILTKMGAAGARLEDTAAYGILTANAAMADTVALFHGTHSNLVSATAAIGAPTVATVSGTEKLVMLQKGPKSAAFLDITPKFWIGPVALKTTAEQFFASRVDPSKSNETPNPYNGKITPVSNPRLDASSTTVWYLVADYRDGQIDTIEVCFLDDEPEPVLKQETEFDTDDVKYAVRHTVAAKALDHRGMAKNPGA